MCGDGMMVVVKRNRGRRELAERKGERGMTG